MTSSPTSPEGSVNVESPLATISRNGQSLVPMASSQSLVMLAEPRSPAAEAYRSLAANLQFAYPDRQLQTIGITSAAAGEGKSTTVANLAVALAEGGRRVIAIDADLRRPGLHELFGASSAEGLSSLLLGATSELPLVETDAPGVRLLTSGPLPSNPLEVLAPRLGGVLLVVSAGRTKRDLARRAREQLERVHANVLGVVLVDARVDDKLYRY